MAQPRVLWCDADGNLFPSEEPAYAASADVTNDFLADVGVPARYTAEELRLGWTGKNFRTTAAALCREHGVDVQPSVLQHWVQREAEVVTAHLGRVLRPDPDVVEPLESLARDHELALVSSSASARLDVCLRASGLDHLFPPAVRFSAEDSLLVPSGKPDPAIYRYAGKRMRCPSGHGIAIEDSAVGVHAAVAAGYATLGNVQFVAEGERAERVETLLDAGAHKVVRSWAEVASVLADHAVSPV
jgi:beta-phosphoglucomutase-like phosphatase (HAD superfamily)